MANTRYRHLLYDAHGWGPSLGLLPPTPITVPAGVQWYCRLAFDAAPGTPAVLNSILRGNTSNAIARIVRIVSPNEFDVESIGLNVPGFLTIAGAAFRTGETVTFDTGGTAVVGGIMGSTRATPDYATQKGDARLETFTPENPVDDQVWWDPKAKACSRILVPASSITGPGGVGPATPESIVKGDRITTSSGGSFTVILMTAVGSDFSIAIARKSGTIAPLDNLTNTRNGALAQIKTGAGSVEADQPVGMWVPHHVKPNLGSLPGTFFENLPRGDGGYGIGIAGPIVRNAWLKARSSIDPADRGARVLAYCSIDDLPLDFTYGGVSIQTVRGTGAFGTTWVLGEAVTGPGGWSGKVVDFEIATKLLFVTDTNGSTLTVGTVTGATSGATMTSDGAAYGWMPGSRSWNSWVANKNTAQAAQFATYLSSPISNDGAFLGMWEGELGPYARGCAFQTVEFIAARWVTFVNAVRAELGNATMPVVLGEYDIRSHSSTVFIPGPPNIPFAFIIGLALQQVARTMPKVYCADCIGFEPQQNLPLPNSTEVLFLRPDDYRSWGERIWQRLAFGAIDVPTQDFDSLDGVWELGHSYVLGGLQAAWGFGDRDADLFPSSLYPSLDTSKPSLLNFNGGTFEWGVFDIALNANSWPLGLNHPGFGFEAPILQRAVRRFAQDGALWGRVGNMKTAFGGSSCNGAVKQASASFDPNGTVRDSRTVTCTVTAIPGTSMQPARGRFTATPGAFAGTSWVVPSFVEISNSGLGAVGSGGNNTLPYRPLPIRAMASDASWIEVEGAFTAEGSRSFTIVVGPISLWPAVRDYIRAAKRQTAVQLNRTFKPKLKIVILSDVDTYLSSEFGAALTRLLLAMDDVFDAQSAGEKAIPTALVKMHVKSPWPVTQAAIDEVRAAMEAVAAARTAAGRPTIVVSIDDLPLEAGGVFPPVSQSDRGVHLTNQAQLDMGYRVDKAAAIAGFLPPHPDGELIAVDLGGAGDSEGGTDGAGDDETQDATDGGTDGPGEPGTGGLIVEDGTGVDDADSFVSIEYFDAFWAKNGNPSAVASATTSQKAKVLRQATREWAEGQFGGLWRGFLTTLTQRLSFPRRGCFDDDGRLVSENTVPWQLLDAICLVGGDVLITGQPILSNSVDRGAVVRETKRGLGFEKTIEYADRGSGSDSVRRMRAAEALVYPFVRGGDSGVSRS